MQKQVLFLLFFSFFGMGAFAQVLYTDPPFPTVADEVVIYFDANEGTGDLAGCNCDVYIHTGLITSESSSPSDWKHVNMTWGQANDDWKMVPVPGEEDLYTFTISPSIEEYYGVNPGEEVLSMSFVFRNADGTITGKGPGAQDIFYPVFGEDLPFSTVLLFPYSNNLVANIGDVLPLKYAASETATFTIFDNGDLIAEVTDEDFLAYDLEVQTPGIHLIEIVADNGVDQIAESFTYAAGPLPIQTEALPADVEPGINYLNDSTIVFALVAPGKENVFLLGDMNDWLLNEDHLLNITPDGKTWWVEVTGLTPGEQLRVQYLVDGRIHIADPYSRVILDPIFDGSIPEENYPDMPEYPYGLTTGTVFLVQPGAPEYPWQIENFAGEDIHRLNIYELLVRDFLHDKNYQTLKDTLDYLERIGINAIELMPVNEFHGNNSWGYNPTYHNALDKFYGSPEAFKAFVDECHARDIAVIVDVVYNHAHELNPLAWMYWDFANYRPAPDNPWMNPTTPHTDFGVFFDFNHESELTKEYFIRILQEWLREYKVDGFRFDVSHGFTQQNQSWQYDATRIATLKQYADSVWSVNPNAYMILEHFAEDSDRKELIDYGNGMLIWAGFGPHDEFQQAAMGYFSNFNGANYQGIGWDVPGILAYIESHDEERTIYKNLNFGNEAPGYSTMDFETALRRAEMTNAFYFSIPGPKMMWQFQELGYDYSINYCSGGSINSSCRTYPKPIRWDYMDHPARWRLYNRIRAMHELRNTYEVFHTEDYNMVTSTSSWKRINLSSDDLNVTVLGNFGVEEVTFQGNFQHTGTWYDYFTGDSIIVNDVDQDLTFAPGEYYVLFDQPVTPPDYVTLTSTKELNLLTQDLSVFPNPNDGQFTLSYNLKQAADVMVRLSDLTGRSLQTLLSESQPAGYHAFSFTEDLRAGMYLVEVIAGGQQEVRKLVVR